MLPRNESLRYVLGGPENFSAQPLPPFAGEVRGFLGELSASLMADSAARALPDCIAFAWWCRKANLEQCAARYDDLECRIGRGLAFHISPSNMPVNFAFSWVFSLLAGNANVVRLPNRDFPQIPLIVEHACALLGKGRYPNVAAMNAFVRYGREEQINQAFSALADARILWGGDETIRSLRRVAPLPAHAIDIGFADRCSLAVFGAEALLGLQAPALNRLAAGFFNDAYLMDQNACSSPRLVLWVGSPHQTGAAMDLFWNAVQAEVRARYTLAPVAAVDKLTQACRDAIDLDCAETLQHGENSIYRIRMNELDAALPERRCGSGYFYEYATENLDDLAAIVTRRYQTLTYFGLPKESLRSLVLRHRLQGIDRIVPVGEAMNIGLVWDGHDLIRGLSRVCDLH